MRPNLPAAAVAIALGFGAVPFIHAQRADTIARHVIAPGLTHTRFVRLDGPLVVHVLTLDLRRSGLTLRHVRAGDQLRGRERTSQMAARRAAAGDRVLAAVNADFFDLRTGENENNQVLGGEWWKGVKVTDSPYDTWDNAHAQFALDERGKPLLDRFVFAGTAISPHGAIPLIALNAPVHPAPEGAALFTPRFGATAPRDSGRSVAEAPLAPAGRRADTLLYVRRGAVSPTSGSVIPPGGALLAGYGPRAKVVSALADGESLRVVLGATPRTPRAAPISLLVGGWPRILRDGVNIAGNAAAEEGTISGNAEARHPRTAIGVSRDSSTLDLATVDGRSKVSVGVTLVELADLMKELGAHQALNFDGGGSTTMLVQGMVVNSPSDPTGEREVGNALLIVGKASPAQAQPTVLPVLDSARLLTDLAVLAHDSMEGRRIGTPGGARARAYLQRALAQIGLSPVADSFASHFTAAPGNRPRVEGVNLLAQTRGTKHPDRYVVVSAHYDHLGVRGTEIFNGADDNASGTAGVLALARWFAAHPPENSIIFALFDGEEAGELGSKAFVDAPPVPRERIVANVNLDMVSRNARGELYAAGAAPSPVFKPLLDSTAAVARVKLLLGHDTGTGQENWIHQSDQGSFADKNIPFVYFGVEDHADYHRSTDDVERIDPGFFYRSVQTVADFVARLDRGLDRVAAARAPTAKPGP